MDETGGDYRLFCCEALARWPAVEKALVKRGWDESSIAAFRIDVELQSQGRAFYNAVMSRGGKRPGSGRPPSDPSGEKRKRVYLFVTDDEADFLRDALQYRRRWVEWSKNLGISELSDLSRRRY